MAIKERNPLRDALFISKVYLYADWLPLLPDDEEIEDTYRKFKKLTENSLKRKTMEVVKKTINLTNQEDSLLCIAYHTYRAIKSYDPCKHVLVVTYLDWIPGHPEFRLKIIRKLLKDHDPIWQVTSIKNEHSLSTFKFEHPGLEYLVNVSEY